MASYWSGWDSGSAGLATTIEVCVPGPHLVPRRSNRGSERQQLDEVVEPGATGARKNLPVRCAGGVDCHVSGASEEESGKELVTRKLARQRAVGVEAIEVPTVRVHARPDDDDVPRTVRNCRL